MTDRNYETYLKLLAQGLTHDEALHEMAAWLHATKLSALKELIAASPKGELQRQKPG